jgi:hypothetical protein
MHPSTFVFRTLLFTVLLVLAMQIRVGQNTIEDHVMATLTSSAVVTPINSVATGAVKFARNMWNKANRSFDSHFSRSISEENRPGTRGFNISIERSEKAIKRTAADVESAAETTYQRAKDSGAYQKFKDKAAATTARIRSKFIDETETPGGNSGAVKSETIR